MKKITAKFGGTSVATAEAIRKAQAIVLSNPARKFIVPSAPGKRSHDDIKITDLLYSWHSIAQQGLHPTEPKAIIEERFKDLVRELGLTLNIHAELEKIGDEGVRSENPDYMASRGEYLNGLIFAEVLDATFIDPAGHIVFNDRGELDAITYEKLGAALAGDGLYVIPGFYGATPSGKVKTFTRGGSDVTGAIVARATQSNIYENWTDVSGFRMADPRLVPEAKHIEELTYQELRELSYMGAQVLHDEAIFPVREPGIAINIRNTNAPDDPGTRIVADRRPKEPVCGIAGRKGFTMINIEKTLMNKERGFGERVLRVLTDHAIGWEHMPTGIDTISLIVRDDELGEKGAAIIEEIKETCHPDRIYLSEGLAMIATVGKGMVRHIGTAARLCTALAEAGVNLRVIDQGSSEMNIIIGVDDQDLERAVSAIYHAFAEQPAHVNS